MMVMEFTAFESKFRDDANPYWKMYQGRSTSANKLIARNDLNENVDESWMLLCNEVGRYESGNVTIVTKPSPNANDKSAITTTVKWGAQAGMGNTRTGQMMMGYQPNNQFQQMQQMMQMFTFFQKLQPQPQKTTAEIITEVTEKLEKEFKIKELESALETAGDPSNIQEAVLVEVAGAIPEVAKGVKMYLAGLSGNRQQSQQAALGTIGQNTKALKEPENTIEPTQQTTTEETPIDASQPKKQVALDINGLVNYSMQIGKALPQYNVNHLMRWMKDWIVGDPEMAAVMIESQLKPKE